MAQRILSTVEQVREAQECLKRGVTFHEAKEYKEAIAEFQKCVEINSFDPTLLKELNIKLKKGGFKLVQESIAHMGCAAQHLFKLIQELDKDDQERVPVDENLQKAFETW